MNRTVRVQCTLLLVGLDDLLGLEDLVGLGVVVSDLFGRLVHFIEQISGLAGGLVDNAVQLGLVLEEEGTDNLGIDDIGSVELDGSHAPDHEDALGQPVEWHPPGQNVCEELKDREESEDDPVGEPLGVIGLAAGLQGLDRTVGRVHKPNSVCEQLSSKSHSQPQNDQSNTPIGYVESLNSSLGFSFLHKVINGPRLSKELGQLVLVLLNRHLKSAGGFLL